MSGLDSCPNCKANWVSDSIPDGLMKTGYYKTKEEADKAAAIYGWTKENNKCFKLESGIYDTDQDRVVGYECPECKFQIKN